MKTYRDLPGDGGSEIVRQVVEQRRKIENRLTPLRHLLAVGSGKGGVGKSTLTLRLALAFAERGLKPAILDADLNGPSQARLAGLSVSPPLPGENGLLVPRTGAGIGVLSFGSLFPEPAPVDFPSVAPSDSFVWRATREFSALGDLLAGTDWGPYDTLLFDLPPGPERTLQLAEFLDARADFILVTLPSDVSRGVVARTISALRRAKRTILGYVENMQGYHCTSCGRVRPLFPSTGSLNLGMECLGSVPFDPKLAAACDQGLTPEIHRALPTTPSIRDMAERIHQILEARHRIQEGDSAA